MTTITVVELPSACAGEPLFAGWFRTRLRSDANDNGVPYEIEVRWNRVGLPSRGSFTWLKGGPGTRSVRATTSFGAELQDVLDREDAVRSIELTFRGSGLESWPRNGLPNLSALFADVWEWLVTVGVAEGVAGHFGSSSGSLLAANAGSEPGSTGGTWEGAANPTPCTDRSAADPSYECRSLLGPGADAD